MTVIDTPQGIAWYQFLQVYFGIKIQAQTGLTHGRGSMIKLAQQRYGIKSRTAKGALREMQAIKDAAEKEMYG